MGLVVVLLVRKYLLDLFAILYRCDRLRPLDQTVGPFVWLVLFFFLFLCLDIFLFQWNLNFLIRSYWCNFEILQKLRLHQFIIFLVRFLLFCAWLTHSAIWVPLTLIWRVPNLWSFIVIFSPACIAIKLCASLPLLVVLSLHLHALARLMIRDVLTDKKSLLNVIFLVVFTLQPSVLLLQSGVYFPSL